MVDWIVILEGSARVEGDEDEDDLDDIENELKFARDNNPQHIAEAMFSRGLNVGRAPSNASGLSTPAELDPTALPTETLLLTYGQEVETIICFRSLSVIIGVFF